MCSVVIIFLVVVEFCGKELFVCFRFMLLCQFPGSLITFWGSGFLNFVIV
jgi:hypothetical protein